MTTSTRPPLGADELARAVAEVADLLRGRRTVALTGAGLSTEAGLPDYRGSGVPEREPISYQQFVGAEHWRRYCWARNQAGWSLLERLAPTAGHRALAELEAGGLVGGVITQNVDRLHTRAGSRRVHELHGAYDRVVCLDCGDRSSRAELDARLRSLNPGLVAVASLAEVEVLPAADESRAIVCTFETAPCDRCGGTLKPDVVFFGELLPADEMERSFALVEESDVLLVAGTSLAVQTGMWMVQEALDLGRDVVVVNHGPTAADRHATVRVTGGTGEVLGGVAERLAQGA
ncbi:Sir2 family NAD-dependent protein deacetylase [Georgenia subflava]|uniref:protein acetyllysine N-acetyltransferase n=1 Tax=Georgenia subflava TaxID=1622177 RepID=A0A6N7EIZ1_9MICO|nr:Sir2 family NAD-dependent protein deacetylase [Georgenia subflava]MPV37043.1 NAD-dependent deacetylase [Georgenia subflava]